MIVCGDGELLLRVEQRGLLGQPSPVVDQELAAMVDDTPIGTVKVVRGVARLDGARIPSVAWSRLGVARSPTSEAPAEIEAWAWLLRPGAARVTLVGTRFLVLATELLRPLGELAAASDRLVIVVRLEPTEGWGAIREQLALVGFDRPLAIDGPLLLDEGEGDDVPAAVEGVRLCRVAARLRAAGIAVDSVAIAGRARPAADGFAVLLADESREGAAAAGPPAEDWSARIGASWVPPVPASSLASRLDALTGSRCHGGHRVEFELRNDHARLSLLGAIAGAQERIHLQFYIVADDEVSAEVERALADAAGRGVRVRLLVDSLYSLHGSFGNQNPLLDRLAAKPGIEVRASRPIDHLPSVEDLKQRDHRKLVIVDGRLGVVSGRNLARSYYVDFAEVTIGPASPGVAVPWLDAGARIEGPVVSVLDAAFCVAWVEAGGEPFAVIPNGAVGPTTARVVIHRGLRDAYTLETYLALIGAAREHLTVINNFPLQLEVQHALLGAIGRGVALRVLFGRVRPVYGDDQPFAGGTLRELANQLVHARMDDLVHAGASVFEYAVALAPGWDPALRMVRPNVHAKLLSADGSVCALGSANLDVTAGYWESEALLVLEDVAATRALDGELEALFTGSARIDPEDPAWRRRAERRVWLSRYWPSVIG